MVTDWTWLIDVIRELLRVGGTILGVLIGAKIAFRNASQGRREDILLKEKYKLFEYMQAIFKDIEDNYSKIEYRRSLVIGQWIRYLNKSSGDRTNIGDVDIFHSLLNLREDSDKFHGRYIPKLFDFRVELMFSKDLYQRMSYVNETLAEYMAETIKITYFIEENMKRQSNITEEVLRDKLKEWRYYGGYNKAGSAINMLYGAMFAELNLPVERKMELMPLDEYKSYEFNPKITLTAIKADKEK